MFYRIRRAKCQGGRSLRAALQLCAQAARGARGWTSPLSVTEKTEHIKACAAFDAAWTTSYPNCAFIPKGHFMVVHVTCFLDKHDTCGVFGEGGGEAVHVKDSTSLKLVWQMKNPEARHKAQTSHHIARMLTPLLKRAALPRTAPPPAPPTPPADLIWASLCPYGLSKHPSRKAQLLKARGKVRVGRDFF
jgi:hypothetical protein